MALACNQVSKGSISVTYEDIGSCEAVLTCNWTEEKACVNDCFGIDFGCNTEGLGDSETSTFIALSLNIIAVVVLCVASLAIFVKSWSDKHGKYIKWIVLIAGICGLVAIFAFVAGADNCLDGTTIGASIIVDIIAVIICFADVVCLYYGYKSKRPIVDLDMDKQQYLVINENESK